MPCSVASAPSRKRSEAPRSATACVASGTRRAPRRRSARATSARPPRRCSAPWPPRRRRADTCRSARCAGAGGGDGARGARPHPSHGTRARGRRSASRRGGAAHCRARHGARAPGRAALAGRARPRRRRRGNAIAQGAAGQATDAPRDRPGAVAGVRRPGGGGARRAAPRRGGAHRPAGKLERARGLERERVGSRPPRRACLREREQFGEVPCWVRSPTSSAPIRPRPRSSSASSAPRCTPSWCATARSPTAVPSGTPAPRRARCCCCRSTRCGRRPTPPTPRPWPPGAVGRPVRSWVRALLGKVRTSMTAPPSSMPGRGLVAGHRRRRWSAAPPGRAVPAARRPADHRGATRRRGPPPCSACMPTSCRRGRGRRGRHADGLAQQEAQRATSLAADRERTVQRLQRDCTEAEALDGAGSWRGRPNWPPAPPTAPRASRTRAIRWPPPSSARSTRASAGHRRGAAGCRPRDARHRAGDARAGRGAAPGGHRARGAPGLRAAGAAARLEALNQELAAIDAADDELARQMTAWRDDLAGRTQSLASAEQALEEAEHGVRAADAALGAAEHRSRRHAPRRHRDGRGAAPRRAAPLRFSRQARRHPASGSRPNGAGRSRSCSPTTWRSRSRRALRPRPSSCARNSSRSARSTSWPSRSTTRPSSGSTS